MEVYQSLQYLSWHTSFFVLSRIAQKKQAKGSKRKTREARAQEHVASIKNGMRHIHNKQKMGLQKPPWEC
jgi:hypothetical protein